MPYNRPICNLIYTQNLKSSILAGTLFEMWFDRVNSLNEQNSVDCKLKFYTFNGLCMIVTCVLMYRDLTTSESLSPEVVFHVIPLYVQILITLIGSTIQKISLYYCTSGNHRKTVIQLLHWIYLVLTFSSLIVGNWLHLSSENFHEIWKYIIQIFLSFIPIISNIRYCRTCIEFRNDYHDLNKLVVNDQLNAKKLMAIRAERKRLNDHVGRMTGGVYGVEILSEIAMTAIVTVFNIHRVLRSSTDRFENTVTQESAADLLDVLNRVLRLFALCKISGDVTKEANEIIIHLLNVNPNLDKNLENEVLFFLWEIYNPLLEVRLVYGTFALGPKLFISVLSWCVGFILILLQFRWPRMY